MLPPVGRSRRRTRRASGQLAWIPLGSFEEPRLDATSERHLVALPPPPAAPGDPIAALGRDGALGLVVEMASGCPNHWQIGLLRRAVRLGRRVWVFWPEEGLVECVTPERLGSYRRHWLVINFYRFVAEPVMRLAAGPRRISYALGDMPPRAMPGWIVRRMWRMIWPATAAATMAEGDHPPPAGSEEPHVAPMVGTRSAWERCARPARSRKPSRFRRSPPFPISGSRFAAAASISGRTSGRRSSPAAATATPATSRRSWPR